MTFRELPFVRARRGLKVRREFIWGEGALTSEKHDFRAKVMDIDHQVKIILIRIESEGN